MIKLAIDLDGVLHDHLNPIPGMKMGRPIRGAQEAMEDLAQRGYKLIIHTCKARTASGIQAVADWLEYYDIPYHEVTAVKPIAKFYIDDNAIHFTDWEQTLTHLGVNDD